MPIFVGKNSSMALSKLALLLPQCEVFPNGILSHFYFYAFLFLFLYLSFYFVLALITGLYSWRLLAIIFV